MSFVENVATLWRYLSVPETLELTPAIRAMNTMMGITAVRARNLFSFRSRSSSRRDGDIMVRCGARGCSRI